jgi:hypothetical protein
LRRRMIEERNFRVTARTRLGFCRHSVTRKVVARAALERLIRIRDVCDVTLSPSEMPGLDRPAFVAFSAGFELYPTVFHGSAGTQAERPLGQVLSKVILVTTRAFESRVCRRVDFRLGTCVAGVAGCRRFSEVAAYWPDRGQRSQGHE